MGSVEINNVGKKYDVVPRSSFHEHAGATIRSVKDSFWALRNVSFSAFPGEIVGIVGKNGAGKTTLMSIIAGIVKPTEGAVTVRGSIASLFNLGTGFQDELSGKENIFLNGAVLGMRREQISERLQAIIDFSELGDFIHMPLGQYSQGMRLRLGFSVAAHLDPDVFVIDEVLLVGDGGFQKKCFERLVAMKNAGKTMIISSQHLDVIERLSDRCLLLEQGRVVLTGGSQDVGNEYRKLFHQDRVMTMFPDAQRVRRTKWWVEPTEQWGVREGTKEVEIEKVAMVNEWGMSVRDVYYGDPLMFKVHVHVRSQVERVHLGVAIFREDGVYCYGVNTKDDGVVVDRMRPGRGWFHIKYPHFDLMPGTYVASIAVWDEHEVIAYDYLKGMVRIAVVGEKNLRKQLVKHRKCTLSGPLRPVEKKIGADVHDRLLAGVPASGAEGVRCTAVMGAGDMNVSSEFLTGEALSVNVVCEIKNEQVPLPCLVWIGIFRSDGVYCDGVFKEVRHREERWVMSYDACRLMPGGYRIAAAVWDRAAQVCYARRDDVCRFEMCSVLQDHGTWYLDHSWKIMVPKK